ncbi:MAG: hypothetical protein CMJ20_11785 [Phycisphaeraceae bacterium]|nr:hypothetical protein [Phycisphaeraceae bacterium]
MTVLFLAGISYGHNGRRFEVVIHGDKLVAQGYNSGADDQAEKIRPYSNAIHDHWSNSPLGGAATAGLPGFDLFSPNQVMLGHDLRLNLLGAKKWISPPSMPMGNTVPDFIPLDPSEVIFVHDGHKVIDTNKLGFIELINSIEAEGHRDLDISYEIASEPNDIIFALEFELSTSFVGIKHSDTIYAILSPDGGNMEDRLHMSSLLAERYLGTPIPEPSGVFGLALMLMVQRRLRY